MKNFKKIVIFAISLCIIFSIIMTSPIYASTDDSRDTKRPNITDIVPDDIETCTIYLYKPDDWGDHIGIYWDEGSYNCELDENKVDGKGWPGYEVTQTEESDKNIYVAKVPKGAKYVQFNNLIYGEGQRCTFLIGSCIGDSKIFVRADNPGLLLDEGGTERGELLY